MANEDKQDACLPNVERLQEQIIRRLDNESKQSDSHAADTESTRLERENKPRGKERGKWEYLRGNNTGHLGEGIPNWSENWYEVATRVCTVDDGVSDGLVRPKGWRVNALKAAGNAIVPQVAHQLIKAIVEVDNTCNI